MIDPTNAISIRNGDTSMDNGPADSVVARYFHMWNTGDTTIAYQILHPDWIDHAHPEVAGPAGVQQAIQTIRAGGPDLHFNIHTILGDNNLIAAVGSVGQPQQATSSPGHLIWLIRLDNGLMAEMWTYRQNQPACW
jgi:SnoaL-like domain